MPTNETSSGRRFRVHKDNGEFWDMIYSSGGVRWERTDSAFEAAVHNQRHGPNLGSGLSSRVQAISSVIDTAASIGMWWESRQQRLLNEAVNEESRRIAWLADMVARWGDAHREGDQLDLRVSEYLAREAREMMDAIVANKRVALPQSMLYELETIQDTLRAFRSLLLDQFEALSGATGIDLDGAIRSALPNSKLDMDFIRSLGKDPSIEWAERVRTKTVGDFERELTDALRHPSVFLSRVFPRTELAIPEPQEVEKPSGVVERLIGLMAPALPRLIAIDSKPDASERRDAFRELSLLPAEVARVKALHSAWLATSAIVAVGTGNELRVQVSAGGVDVGLVPPPAALELPPARASHA